MFTMKKSVTALAVAVSLGMAAPAFADGTTGYIQGNAIQTEGTKISNATITITNSQIVSIVWSPVATSKMSLAPSIPILVLIMSA